MKKKPITAPPKWAINFLHWFCPDELLEGILGDLLEEYEADLQLNNRRKANQIFIWNALRFFHPSIFLRNHLTLNLINMGMLKSHLLVAFRSMRKYKFYSLVNIAGLSVAIAFVFLSFLFIKSEMDIDQFHSKKDVIWRIYHKVVNVETEQARNISAVTAIPMSKDLKEELPIISQYTRHGSSSITIQQNNTAYTESVTFVDDGFLKMFDFPLLQGNPNTALKQPNSVIISEEKAQKYFGTNDPIGQSLAFDLNDSTHHIVVTGVIDTKADKSSIQFDFLVPFEQYKLLVSETSFVSYNYGIVENYVLIESDQSKAELEASLTEAIQKFSEPDEERLELGLQPLSKMYFDDEILGNALYTSPKKLYIMLALALLVLIIAGINFINLSTSHALNRFKEMGLRKTLGALKGQLRRQLIVESIFVALLSGVLGIVFASVLLPIFASLVDSSIGFSIDIRSILFLGLLIISIGLITGLFQSVVLVKYDAIQALRGNLKLSGTNSWFNQGLVVIQFALSILLIIGAVNIRGQMQYIQNKELGYEQERLIEISLGSTGSLEATRQVIDRFKTQALQDSRVLSISAAMNNSREPWTELKFEQADGNNEALFYNQVDPAYLETMGMELISGEDFNKNASNEATTVLVNEALMQHFGWEGIEGQQIPGSRFEGSHRIAGVVKDFHFSSLHHKIEPLIMVLDYQAIESGVTGLRTFVWPSNLYQLIVRIGPGDIKPVIDHLQTIWLEVNPNKDFVYHFVDEVLENKYAEEKRWGKIINTGSLFAIGIAWLGLLALMRLSMQKRTKEIGIRKVLGASLSGIIVLLSKRFLLLVIIGNLIAWPIGWWLSAQWLASFTYRISLNPMWFLAAGFAVLLLTLASVSLQSLRVARSNPVEALKFE